ncbi:peptide-methionine (S)-S-oxide reductase MsrA [Subsaximicrobium wynnwilliamsii]|uniref:Peptide methionine sulfoxide reductase MsrA n=1 Tax=Subsaximicrobium wynnwilliamsii TaxID=291179 RepID=A0A5C6ZKV4_9FLAO|nr:peptide-methionine (S)-S-oxide reductase MsrA [Subsaximicrobium wynnwilliamsii]TXD84788.1 peptide-methionine (S)-S-oxide reductase MsrA [Subsaximicrobium wynnwilliamsii]TXD90459.1 peptide-methionine (S)-S-oxide reductase MsrA [Subsaximicrobium wynnwilliamsii]TXE04935.1 peptide-methionine (S)-S-oxide reductase MsrA [Subsaximicrobium wynnwilliamsii]
MAKTQLEQLIVGGGCFWCIEAVFNELKGVTKVVSGYAGGSVPGTPTYREVGSGLTGHAEVVQVTFDANSISYRDLLHIFMSSHDPTTSNGREADFGSQYRSVIYYGNAIQKEIASVIVNEFSAYVERPITTEISPAEKFHAAEAYHQNYYANNSSASYCKAIIAPKLATLRSRYADKLKSIPV